MACTHPVPRAALAAALLALGPLLGCPGAKPADCSPAATKAAVLATARSWYLFAERVPDFAAFDPADPTLSPQQFLDAIVAAAGAPDTGRGFSYLSTKAASSQFFDEGTSLGYGLGLRFVGATQLFVSQVFGDAATPPGSPAAAAGFARGDELLAIAPSQAGLDAPASQVADLLARDALSDAFSSGLAGTTRWFRVRHAGATDPVDLTATTATYSLDPLPRAALPIVLTVPAAGSDTGVEKRVGYLHLRTFVGPAAPLLRQAFAALQAQGVTDLIVDLRYDGGGRLDVAGVFVDLLTAGRTGARFGLRHNALHVADDFDWPSGAEAAAIAPARVAFILTRGSASASELLPFVLAAQMGAQVAVIGEASYGKPAGQYGFSDPDCPELLYLLSFQLASGGVRAEYFGGLPDAAWTGGSCAADDDLTRPQGDPAEGMTGAALGWIADRSCAGGAIPVTGVAARRARVLAAPAAPEPSPAQRHVPGLF
jgi:C-terminal processing protease CtpA/Prc